LKKDVSITEFVNKPVKVATGKNVTKYREVIVQRWDGDLGKVFGSKKKKAITEAY